MEDKGPSSFLESSLVKQSKKMASTLRVEEMNVGLIIKIGGHCTNLRTCSRMPKPEPPISITKSKHETSFVRFDADFYCSVKVRFLFPRGEKV